jgi:hypothetical protein
MLLSMHFVAYELTADTYAVLEIARVSVGGRRICSTPCTLLTHAHACSLTSHMCAVLEMQEKVAAIAKAHSPLAMSVATDTKACKQMWMERKEALWSAQAQYPDMECMITDVSSTTSNYHYCSIRRTV